MTPRAADYLNGRRILVVEDDALIAMMVEDMLLDLGCRVMGTARGIAEALALVATGEPPDAALLDVNLDGTMVYPLADALRARGVALIFCTGYAEDVLRETDRGCVVLRKPYRPHELAAALAAALHPA